MKNIKIFDRRLGFSLGALSILFGTMAPAVVPMLASADSQITNRSMSLSTSDPTATGVSYKLVFTPNEGNGSTMYDMAVEFCTNTPLVSSACTAPSGMAFATSSGVGATGSGAVSGDSAAVLKNTAGTAVIGGANFLAFVAQLNTGVANTITFTTVTNPTAANTTFYARVYIFGTDNSTGTPPPYDAAASGNSAHAAAVDGSTAINTSSNVADDGSIALSTDQEIGVQAAVLESLQFCVYGDPKNATHAGAQFDSNASGYLGGLANSNNGPGLSCNDNDGASHNNGSPSPNVTLGQSSDVGQPDNVIALNTSNVSYAADWAQLSTNANSGAVVYLKTNNTCVGLSRNGGTSCQINGPDQGVSGDTSGGKLGHALAAGTQGFGLQFGAVQSAGAGSSGTLTANAQYNSQFAMLDSTATAITDANGTSLPVDTTSTYGGYVFGSNLNPVSNQDMPFSLAASIANNTPSGLYKANLDLIATGTF